MLPKVSWPSSSRGFGSSQTRRTSKSVFLSSLGQDSPKRLDPPNMHPLTYYVDESVKKRDGEEICALIAIKTIDTSQLSSLIRKSIDYFMEKYGIEGHLSKVGSKETSINFVSRLDGLISFYRSIEPHFISNYEEKWEQIKMG